MIENQKSQLSVEFITVLAATVLFWAWAFMFIKIALRELSPEDLTVLRFVIADTFFIPYLMKNRKNSLKKHDLKRVFLLGLFGITVYHICLNYGEVYVSSGVASLIIATAPVFIFISSIIFLKEKVTKLRVFGTLCALTGVIVIIISGENSFRVENYLGAFLVLIAAFSATFYTIYGKSLFSRYKPPVLTAYAITLGTLPLFLLLTPEKIFYFVNLTAETWLSVLFLGIFSTVVGYQGWYYILEKMDASKASVFLQAIPVVAVTSGIVFLGESFNILLLSGGVMVVAGVYLVVKK